MNNYSSINFQEKLSRISELWTPKVIAEMENIQFKLVKFSGEFVWHEHKESDEVFIVLDGEMDVEFRDGLAHIRRGEMFVVRRGMEHRTRSAGLCQALIVEPRGVVNTGDSGGNLTAPMDEWV